jgi:hypothetical protein
MSVSVFEVKLIRQNLHIFSLFNK